MWNQKGAQWARAPWRMNAPCEKEEHDAAVEAVVSGINLILGRIPSRTAVSEFITEYWAKLKLTCQTESDEAMIAERILQLAETEGKKESLFSDQGDSQNSIMPVTRYRLWRSTRAKSAPPPTAQGSGSKGSNKGAKDDQSSSDEDDWGKQWRGAYPQVKAGAKAMKAESKGGDRPRSQGDNKGGKGDQRYGPTDSWTGPIPKWEGGGCKGGKPIESKGSNKGGKWGLSQSSGDDDKVNEAIAQTLDPKKRTKEGGKGEESTGPAGGSSGGSKGGSAEGDGPARRCKWNEQIAVEGILDLPSVTESEWMEASGGLAFVRPETFAAYMCRVPYNVAEEKKAALLPMGWENALKASGINSKELVDFLHKYGVPINLLAKDPMLNETFQKDAIMVTVSKEMPKIPTFKKGAKAVLIGIIENTEAETKKAVPRTPPRGVVADKEKKDDEEEPEGTQGVAPVGQMAQDIAQKYAGASSKLQEALAEMEDATEKAEKLCKSQGRAPPNMPNMDLQYTISTASDAHLGQMGAAPKAHAKPPDEAPGTPDQAKGRGNRESGVTLEEVTKLMQENKKEEANATAEQVNMLIQEGMEKAQQSLYEQLKVGNEKFTDQVQQEIASVKQDINNLHANVQKNCEQVKELGEKLQKTQEEVAAASAKSDERMNKKFEVMLDELKTWLMQNLGKQIGAEASSAKAEDQRLEEQPKAKAARRDETGDKTL